MAEAEAPTVAQVTRSITRAVLLANCAGAVLAYLYLQFLSPGAFSKPTPRGTTLFVISAVMLPLYLGAIGFVAVRHMRRRAGGLADALASGTFTAEERRTALGMLPRATALSAGGWSGAAAIYLVLNLAGDQPVAYDVRIVVGILLGGTMTTALTYLLAERRFRPAAVVALAGEPDGHGGFGVRARMLTAWLVGSAVPLVAVGLTPFEHSRGGLVSLPVSIASLAVIGVVVGFLLVRATASSVTEPLGAVRRALDAVRHGDLSVEVPVDDPGELGRLEADVNRMVEGLRERRRLEELFGRHVGEAVARRALSEEAVLGGQVRELSVLFVDLIGSTALAASYPPDEVVTTLNRLFGTVVDVVSEEGGWINKFEGDGALCVFGVPVELPGHAAAALRSARRLRAALGRPSAEGHSLDTGIGVATGRAVAGNVGALDRYEYTVIGDPVNEAARLSDLAKAAPGRVLASAAAVEAAGEAESAHWRDAGEAVLRGRDRATGLKEPVAGAAGVGQPPATAGTIDTV